MRKLMLILHLYEHHFTEITLVQNIQIRYL